MVDVVEPQTKRTQAAHFAGSVRVQGRGLFDF